MSRSSALQEKVYSEIVKTILTGSISPGTRLIEQDLAADLNVSRVPVRAALTKLVSQGLLIGGQNGQGVWVRQYSVPEIQDLYYYRSVIEGGIVRLVASKTGSNDLLMAKMCCEKMESLIEQPDSDKWGELDHKFHTSLAQACGNERLINADKALLSECHYLFYHYSERLKSPTGKQEVQRKKRVSEEHFKLLGLVSEGKADEAELMVRTSMSQSADRFCEMLIKSELNEKHTN